MIPELSNNMNKPLIIFQHLKYTEDNFLENAFLIQYQLSFFKTDRPGYKASYDQLIFRELLIFSWEKFLAL